MGNTNCLPDEGFFNNFKNCSTNTNSNETHEKIYKSEENWNLQNLKSHTINNDSSLKSFQEESEETTNINDYPICENLKREEEDMTNIYNNSNSFNEKLVNYLEFINYFFHKIYLFFIFAQTVEIPDLKFLAEMIRKKMKKPSLIFSIIEYMIKKGGEDIKFSKIVKKFENKMSNYKNFENKEYSKVIKFISYIKKIIFLAL